MKKINAQNMDYQFLNKEIRTSNEDICIEGALGQRFIAAGLNDKHIEVNGTPGNALGAYLNGGEITVFGNAQDAVGDTMNEGRIVVHGDIGDAAGYSMRGGRILVKGNAGYRAGIHMKEYKEKRPILVIGGNCGSFLGEYQAGGIIVALGLTDSKKDIVSNFPCTGMHGGMMYLRSSCEGIHFPHTVIVSEATKSDLEEIEEYIHEFCDCFGYDKDDVLNATFTKIVPDTANPYKQMYVEN